MLHTYLLTELIQPRLSLLALDDTVDARGPLNQGQFLILNQLPIAISSEYFAK